MNFDTNFKLYFIESLRKNKGLFYDNMFKGFESQQKDLLILAYYNRSTAFESVDYGNISKVWEDLAECLSVEDFPVLRRLLYFSYSTSNTAASQDDVIIKYLGDKSDALESAFWENASMESAFNKLAEFSCFEHPVMQDRLIKKYKIEKRYFNADEWCEYYLRLLQLFMPQYPFKKDYSDKKVLRFLCDVGNGCQFGFEFNASSYKNELRNYDRLVPAFRIIFVNAGFNKSIKEDAYWMMNEHPHIFVASEAFENPYFRGILKIIDSLFIKVNWDPGIGGYQVIDLRNDSLLQQNGELEKVIKRYAFFEFYLITYFIKPYLEYLAVSFKNISDQVSDKLLTEQINYMEDRNQFLSGEIENTKTMIAQGKAQKIPKKLYQQLEYGVALFKKECEENNKLILKYREQLKSS